MSPEKIIVGGIEYAVIREGDSTVLEMYDSESRMTVRNVFVPRPDSKARMRSFKEQVASLLLQEMTGQ